VNVHVRSLDDQADRDGFDCGVDALDDWLRNQAGQAQRKRLASVWIASPVEDPARVVGYYSLAPWQVAFERCPAALRKRLPHYPLAVSLIARLAVTRQWQGQGWGGFLLVDALDRARRASDLVPVQAVVVHAKDERVAALYERYGFVPFPAQPLHLYLPMESVAQALRV
jgi:GNAT superfamily N-acetyltransferase